MKFKRTGLAGIKFILGSCLFFPFMAFAHLMTITASTPFPSSVAISSTSIATFTVTNIASRITLTAVNQSVFPAGSGLSVVSSTCGVPMKPQQQCNIVVQLQAPAIPQTISSELRIWDKPSADAERFPFAVNVISQSPLVVVGTSFSVSNNQLPLAYKSTDTGNNWTLSPAFTLPVGETQAKLLATSCVGSTCIAGGTTGNNLPLGYKSFNGGSTWSLLPDFVLPVGQIQGTLNAVSCVGNLCNAVGYSSGTGGAEFPLAYKSTDAGNTWTLAPPFVFPAGQVSGVLFGADCLGTSCLAVGSSFDNMGNNEQPLAYKSTDGGSTWALTAPFAVPGGTQTEGFLNSVFCLGTTCNAVGYSHNNVGGHGLALAYKSTDGGNTWILSPALPLPAGQVLSSLGGVSCLGSICVAVGTSTDSSGNNGLALAYKSIDGGLTWALSPAFPLLSGQTESFLTGVTCSGTVCIAIGGSSDNSGNVSYSLAYKSSDGGSTWTLASSAFAVPSGQVSTVLNGVTNSG